jgi:RecA-family ATPase
MRPSTTPSTFNAIFYPAVSTNSFELRRFLFGSKVGLQPDSDHDRIRATAVVNVSMPKSGTAISIAVALSTGTPWMGRDVTQGTALIIAGEGGALLQRRIAAAFTHAGLQQNDQIFVISDSADLYANKDTAALEKIVGELDARLIVWDTLNTHSGTASENSGEMKTVLRNMQKVARISGATNLIIAHPGKDTSRGLRGW